VYVSRAGSSYASIFAPLLGLLFQGQLANIFVIFKKTELVPSVSEGRSSGCTYALSAKSLSISVPHVRFNPGFFHASIFTAKIGLSDYKKANFIHTNEQTLDTAYG